MSKTLVIAATAAMMLAGPDAKAFVELASLAGATGDTSPIVDVTCPGAGLRDRCPVGLYLACTLDRRCACISCFAFRRYPDDYHWYRWGY